MEEINMVEEVERFTEAVAVFCDSLDKSNSKLLGQFAVMMGTKLQDIVETWKKDISLDREVSNMLQSLEGSLKILIEILETRQKFLLLKSRMAATRAENSSELQAGIIKEIEDLMRKKEAEE